MVAFPFLRSTVCRQIQILNRTTMHFEKMMQSFNNIKTHVSLCLSMCLSASVPVSVQCTPFFVCAWGHMHNNDIICVSNSYNYTIKCMIRELKKKGVYIHNFRNGYPFPFQSVWLNRCHFQQNCWSPAKVNMLHSTCLQSLTHYYIYLCCS